MTSNDLPFDFHSAPTDAGAGATAIPLRAPEAASRADEGEGEREGFWSLCRADLRGMVIDRGRPRLFYALEVALKIALYPRIRCVLLFRLAQLCWRWRLSPVSYFLMGRGLGIAGAEIHPGAHIGPGFCLVHSGGVVIGDRARIGAHFICFQGVTVGDSGHGDGQPALGNWVTAGAGAKILGGISVGSGATIGANSVVLRDVPPGGVAVGAPARVARVRPVDEEGKVTGG
jgi:serine O-acetyltransferase